MVVVSVPVSPVTVVVAAGSITGSITAVDVGSIVAIPVAVVSTGTTLYGVTSMASSPGLEVVVSDCPEITGAVPSPDLLVLIFLCPQHLEVQEKQHLVVPS